MKASHKYRSVLGIAIDERRLTAAVLHRTGRGVEVRQSMSAGMALDPLANDPELVGGEIRNLLTEAGIREKRCVLCLPLKRALTMQTSLPDLSEPDLKSFIQTQAEREFPLPIEHLSVSVMRNAATNGTRHALVAGILKAHLEAHLKALRHAGLRPVGVTFGVTSLGEEPAGASGPTLKLLAWDGSLDLAIQDGRSLYTLRSISDVATYEQGHPDIHMDAVAKQLRITLGQLDPALLSRIRTVQVFGPSRLATELRKELEPYGRRMGMAVETGGVAAVVAATPDVLEETSPAILNAAAGYLNGHRTEIEFLPPRTNPLQRILKLTTQRSALLPAGLGITVVAILVAVFVLQHVRLTRLRADWGAIESKVAAVEELQSNVRLYRPWFDETVTSLLVARGLAEAFPEDGSVWAKEIDVRTIPDQEGLAVTCTGKARSNADWLRMRDRLRGRPGVSDLRFQQVSGTNPLQFSVSFLWKDGGENGE